MSDIALFTYADPGAIGDGGNHRSYQIRQDLEAAVGSDRIQVFNPYHARFASPVEESPRSPLHGIVRRARKSLRFRLIDRLRGARENPYKLLTRTKYSVNMLSRPAFLAYYEASIRQQRPALCVIEHTGFAGVVRLNRQYGIPTIACPQNLDAFDMTQRIDHAWGLEAAMYDFANELALLRECDYGLYLSKVETALVMGLGGESIYYPYWPVGEIAEFFRRVRERRQETSPEPGCLLLLGSGHHPTTYEGMAWFIQQAQAHGLPEGIKVIVGGTKTGTRLPEGVKIPGVELTGWLDQDRLERLLTEVEAVLIPQFRGFGALTKLVEVPYAGVPVITAAHPTYAVDLLPGVTIVDDRWESWIEAMRQPRAMVEGVIAEARPLTLQKLVKSIGVS